MTFLQVLPKTVMQKLRSRAYEFPIIIAFVWILGLVLSPFTDDLGQRIESAVYPVVSTAMIEGYHEENDETVFWGSSNKLRECRFDRIEWWEDDGEGRSVRVPIETTIAPVRGEGPSKWGPYKIKRPADILLNRTHAYSYHDCHWGWMTRTVWWNGSDRHPKVPKLPEESKAIIEPKCPDVYDPSTNGILAKD